MSSSSSKPGRRPAGSFLTILVEPDFDTTVMVPPHFSNKYKTSLSRKKVRLRIGSGKTWSVKVEKMEGGRYALTSGWDGFFHGAGLQYGEFVIFKLAESSQLCTSTFDVSVYGVHGCECLAPVYIGNKSFTVKFHKRRKPSMMRIPKAVATEETGIKAGEWIKLRNGEGGEWAVEVCSSRTGKEGSVLLKEGWRAFWEENKFCLGNKLRFELVDTKPPTLLVVVVTKGTRGGRPRKNV